MVDSSPHRSLCADGYLHGDSSLEDRRQAFYPVGHCGSRVHYFGHTFLPTDTLLLALTMLTAFISIVFITAVTGRAWCGWACPQTVYIEFLFRPIDRLFDGTTGKGGSRNAS